jgi:hypothetical protein
MMKKSDIKIIQHYLADAGLYPAEIDGKRGSKTDKAVSAALAGRPAELPGDWPDWSANRKAVACLQLFCRDRDIDAGKIDGLYGPQTESAAEQLRILTATGELPRGFGDIVPIRANPLDFPPERQEALNDYYGEPCQGKLVRVRCPWTLRLDWNLEATTTAIAIHEKLSQSLADVLEEVFTTYGAEGIKKYGLDRYGGSFNCRKKRGSLSAWSTHAWGIALDWYPSRNKLNWNSRKASLAHPDLDPWWEIWERYGWTSLGRTEDRDWMHVQAAKR